MQDTPITAHGDCNSLLRFHQQRESSDRVSEVGFSIRRGWGASQALSKIMFDFYPSWWTAGPPTALSKIPTLTSQKTRR
jgi:hypothetical protein